MYFQGVSTGIYQTYVSTQGSVTYLITQEQCFTLFSCHSGVKKFSANLPIYTLNIFPSRILSFLAVTFLEYWKRKNASLAHHWDCSEFEEEEV